MSDDACCCADCRKERADTRRKTAPLLIRVIGQPAPQGSKRLVGRHLIESSAGVQPWRDSVAWAARSAAHAAHWTQPDGPVAVDVRFYLPRPAAARRRRFPHTRPDLDKLIRSTLDALTTSGVVVDDARVVKIDAAKLYADEQPHHTQGCVIQVTALDQRPTP